MILHGFSSFLYIHVNVIVINISSVSEYPFLPPPDVFPPKLGQHIAI